MSMRYVGVITSALDFSRRASLLSLLNPNSFVHALTFAMRRLGHQSTSAWRASSMS
jgi:hypothetical protein